MLIRLTKVSIGGKTTSGLIILNTDYLTQLRVNGTGAEFKYMEQPEDSKRARKCLWVVEETVARIRGVMNDAPFAVNMIELDVFPNNNVLVATRRQFYNIAEIVKIYPYNLNRNYSWILLNLKGVKLERLLVDNYYLDFVSVGATGSSSTTTSSTSTTSTSTTSTSSTSTTSTYTTNTSTSTSTTLP